MKEKYLAHFPQFFTATILNWEHLLAKDEYKNIIVSSLQFLVKEERITLLAFVLKSNHVHLIWQALTRYTPEKVQLSFMKFTAQQIKFNLQANDPALLTRFRVDKKDREYQIWKRKPLSVDLYTPSVFKQKLNYIHNNPVKAGLCKSPREYYYSSARFYETGVDHFGMLTHYMG